MHKRTAHRWQLGSLMMGGALLALGSFWLVQVVTRNELVTPDNGLKTEPDYIVDKFSFVRMTPAGKPGYIISGEKLTHRPDDDSLHVTQPVVRNLSSKQPPMTMNAKEAHIDQTNNVVELTGDVDISRPQQGAVKALNLKTAALTVFPDEERMETKQPFQMDLGSSSVSGVGMKANNATGQLDVQGKSQMILQPRAR
jgi:lipopolysaccharide export system protein LptC